jgi:outer membrane biosynthesis protein TonB
VTVVKPLGLGLDEEAVHAVTSWTFTPSQKDGSAVAVQINVEVTFRLY